VAGGHLRLCRHHLEGNSVNGKSRGRRAWVVLLSLAALRIALAQIRPEVETRIVVETTPHAQVFLDGIPRGEVAANGLLAISNAKAGTHELRVEGLGKRPFRRTISVVAGQATTIQAKLEDTTGDLEVFTSPHAAIALNGTAAGTADASGRLLVRGRKAVSYTVRATLEGYLPAEQPVTLQPDMVNSLTIDLVRGSSAGHSSSPPPSFARFRRLLGHDDDIGDIRGVFFRPDGELVSWANRIIEWDTATGRQLRATGIDPQKFFRLSPDLRWVAFAFYNSETNSNRAGFIETARAHEMWDRGEWTGVKPNTDGTPACYSPDSKRVAIVDRASEDKDEGSAQIWDLESRQLQMVLNDRSIGEIAYSPDGKFIVTGRSRVVVWDASTGAASGQRLRELPAKGGVRRLVFSADGRLLAVVGTGLIDIWDLADGHAVSTIDISGVNVADFYDAVFTRDAKHLIASRNPDLYIFDVASGKQVGEPYKQTRGMLALSPDGRHLAVAEGHNLTLWRRTN